MENKEDDIEKLFKAHFSDDEAPVSPLVWENIQKTLPPETVIKAYGFSLNGLFWILTGLLLMVIITGILLYAPQKNISRTNSILGSANETSKLPVETNTTKAVNKPFSTEGSPSLPSPNTASTLFHDSLSFTREERSSVAMQVNKQSKIETIEKAIPYADKNAGEKENSILSDDKDSKKNTLKKDPLAPLAGEKKVSSLFQKSTPYSIEKTDGKKNLSRETSSQSIGHGEGNSDDSISTAFPTSFTHVSLSDNGQLIDSTQKTNSASASQKMEVGNNSNSFAAVINEENNTTSEAKKSNSSDSILSRPGDSLPAPALVTIDTTYDLPFTIDSLKPSIDSMLLAKVDSSSQLTNEPTEHKKTKNSKNFIQHLTFDLTGGLLATGAVTKSRSDVYAMNVSNKNTNDKSRLGFSLGVAANYRLNEKFSLSTGLSYFSCSEQYNHHYNIKKDEYILVDSSWQVVQVDSINKDIKATNVYQFISIPLQISYSFLTKEKIKLSVMIGIRGNWLLKGKTYLPNANQDDVTEWDGLNHLSLAYSGGIELQYQLGSNLGLLVQPQFLYNATSVHTKNSGIIQKPYGIGLNLGLRFGF